MYKRDMFTFPGSHFYSLPIERPQSLIPHELPDLPDVFALGDGAVAVGIPVFAVIGKVKGTPLRF